MRNSIADLKAAKMWAEEFLSRVETFEKGEGKKCMSLNDEGIWPWPSYEWAAIKRASLDLSRALTQIRKSRYVD